jgi:hypothetical protein
VKEEKKIPIDLRSSISRFLVRNSCELTRREVNRQKTKGELTLVGERIKFVNIELWKLACG